VHLLKNLARCGLVAIDNDLNSSEQSLLYMGQRVFNNTLHSRKVLLHPGAGSKKKMWPITNFLQVERRLESDGYRPEYIMGPADRFLRDALRMPGVRPRVVHTPENIPALAALMKTAGGYIGNDSGVSHLAAYLGLPTVAVFGPSNPEMWRPIGPRVQIVRPSFHGAAGVEPHRKNSDSQDCFAEITPAIVLDSFYKIFRQG
jgi:ADP-heptose:LPS heptosyltransferase